MSLTAEQLEMRKTGLGGSDIAAILGVDPYKSAIDVWLRCTGRASLAEVRSEALEESSKWGHRLEQAIADELAERTGLTLRHSDTVRNPFRPWMLATPDRLAFPSIRHRKPVAGVECKNRSARLEHQWGESGTDDVPDAVRAQVAWYMAAFDLDAWFVGVLIGGNRFRYYPIRRDREVEAGILEVAERFWLDHVEADVAPPVDGSKSARAYLASLWPETRRPLEPSTEEAERLAADLAAVKVRLKEGEAEEKRLTTRLCELVGDREGYRGDGWTFTWKREAGRVAWKDVATEAGVPAELVEKHRGEASRVPRFR